MKLKEDILEGVIETVWDIDLGTKYGEVAKRL